MLSFLSVILRKKKTIILAAIVGFVISIIVSLVLPAKYISLGAFIPGGVEQEHQASTGRAAGQRELAAQGRARCQAVSRPVVVPDHRDVLDPDG